jgi:hypothetical protein
MVNPVLYLLKALLNENPVPHVKDTLNPVLHLNAHLNYNNTVQGPLYFT